MPSLEALVVMLCMSVPVPGSVMAMAATISPLAILGSNLRFWLMTACEQFAAAPECGEPVFENGCHSR